MRQENGSSVFESGAREFAREIDRAIEHGVYWRGTLFIELLKQSAPLGSLALDYGCGPGRITLMLARSGFRVIGVDPSESMLALAREQHCEGLQVQFQLGKEDVLIPDSFDVIICSSVIEYVREPDKLLHAFHNSLRRNGVLIVSFSNKLSPTRFYYKLTRHQNPFGAAYQHEWSWKEFRELLMLNGFIPTSKPKFFEGPPRIESFVRLLPLGTLGVVAARRDDPA